MVGLISSSSRSGVKTMILYFIINSVILCLSPILLDFIEDFPVTSQKYVCNALRIDDKHVFLPGLKYRSLLFDVPLS
jgi:hypothetical protein